MTIRAFPYITLNAFLFGSTLVASRFAVGQFLPANYITLRLLLATLLFLLAYLVLGNGLPRDGRLWRHGSVYGIFGTGIELICIVSALQYISSGLAGIFLTTGPAITALIAHFVLPNERLNRAQWIGVLLALSGAAMLAISGQNGLSDMAVNPLGYLLMATGVFLSASMTVYARRFLKDYGAFQTASVRMFTATIFVVLYTFLFVGFDTSEVALSGLGALGWAAVVGTFFGFMMQFFIIRKFSAISAALVQYLIPIVGGVGGVLLLDETFTPLMFVGVVIIISGISLVQQLWNPETWQRQPRPVAATGAGSD